MSTKKNKLNRTGPKQDPEGKGKNEFHGYQELSLEDPGSASGFEVAAPIPDVSKGAGIRSPIVEAVAPPPAGWGAGRQKKIAPQIQQQSDMPPPPPPVMPQEAHAARGRGKLTPQQAAQLAQMQRAQQRGAIRVRRGPGRRRPVQQVVYPGARHHAANPYIKRRRWILAILCLAILGFLGWYGYQNPDKAQEFADRTRAAVDDLLVRFQMKDGERIVRKKPPRTKSGKRIKTLTAEDLSCKNIYRSGLNRVIKNKLSVADRVAVADCFMLANDPIAAGIVLGPTQNSLMKLNDKQLKAQRSNHAAINSFFGLLVAYNAQGQNQKVDQLLRGRCTKWDMTPACAGKLWVYTQRELFGSAAEGFRRMQSAVGRLDRYSESYFWMSAAKLAAQAGSRSVSYQRYEYALQTTPPSAVRIRRDIHESYAIALYHEEEWDKLRRVTARSLKELRGISNVGLTKLSLLQDISASPSKRKTTIKKVLDRPEIYQRVSGDVAFIDVLGVEAIRAGMARQLIELIKRTDDKLSVQFRSTSDWSRRLVIWEIRSLIAANEWESALNAINFYVNRFQEDYLSHHLRGVVYMNAAPGQRYQLLAAQQFQSSLKLRLSWEGLCAFGIALTRGGKVDQVPQIIKQLQAMGNRPNEKHWNSMLKLEHQIAQGDLEKAAKGLESTLKAKPDSYLAHALLMDVYKKTNRIERERNLALQFDELQAKTPYMDTLEGMGSPYGPLAQARNPGY